MREPDPGDTAVNVTSWPGVAASARNALSERLVPPLPGMKVPDVGSKRNPFGAPFTTTLATSSHSVVEPPSTLEVNCAAAEYRLATECLQSWHSCWCLIRLRPHRLHDSRCR